MSGGGLRVRACDQVPGCFSIKYWTDTDRTTAPTVCIQMCLLNKHFPVFRKTGLVRDKCPLVESRFPIFHWISPRHEALRSDKCFISISLSLFLFLTTQHNEYHYVGVIRVISMTCIFVENNGMRQQRVISNKHASTQRYIKFWH